MEMRDDVGGHVKESASYKSESSNFRDILSFPDSQPFAKPFFYLVPHTDRIMFRYQRQT